MPISKRRLLLLQFFLTFLIILSSTSPRAVQAQDLDVPYVPTPEEVVEKMLDLTMVDSSDYVIDLGSGDGRIVIAAAKRGAAGHGIDLDPKRIAEARENAEKQGVTDQLLFKQENLFDTDFSAASVITMYLLPSVNKKLRPHLLEELEPGTRIVSHSFDMGDWQPDKKVEIDPENSSRTHTVYYWMIPAKAEGSWTWDAGGRSFTMKVQQQYQQISVSLSDENDTSYEITREKLKGDRIAIHAVSDNDHYIFSGRIADGTIRGMMQHHSSGEESLAPWSAQRQ